MSYTYGYHRTSTKEQHLGRGVTEIEKFCSERKINLMKIYTDQHTGKNFNRPRYTVLKEDILRRGDILIITEVDRLGRNKKEILKELRELQAREVRIMILEIPTTLIDLSVMDNSMAKMMMETINNMLIEMYASLAEAEITKKEKRQREGIEQKKLRGEWDEYGRPQIMKPERFKKEYEKVRTGQLRPFELMRALKMKKSTYYKYKKMYCDNIGGKYENK